MNESVDYVVRTAVRDVAWSAVVHHAVWDAVDHALRDAVRDAVYGAVAGEVAIVGEVTHE
jgi:hypothetical protein